MDEESADILNSIFLNWYEKTKKELGDIENNVEFLRPVCHDGFFLQNIVKMNKLFEYYNCVSKNT
jgi:hypothetical protein